MRNTHDPRDSKCLFAFIVFITLYCFLPIENSTSTIQSDWLMEFGSCGLLILRNGLPKRPKHKASSIVDLPAPFGPNKPNISPLLTFKLIFFKLSY